MYLRVFNSCPPHSHHSRHFPHRLFDLPNDPLHLSTYLCHAALSLRFVVRCVVVIVVVIVVIVVVIVVIVVRRSSFVVRRSSFVVRRSSLRFRANFLTSVRWFEKSRARFVP